MRLFSYLQSAKEILTRYDGAVPLAAWLKNYFREHKKFGSKDRKAITGLCFSYYRLGGGWTENTIEDRLLIAQFLCQQQSPFIKEIKPEWFLHAALSVPEKLQFLGQSTLSIFPFQEELSEAIDAAAFPLSFLIQPDLFLRIRPGKREAVIKKLAAAFIDFSIEDGCLRLANMSKIEELLLIDNEAVVQDKSSQQVLQSLIEQQPKQVINVWDCCAASGGKSILLADHFTNSQLTVSDIRESIIHNLKKRFSRAAILRYQAFVADLSLPRFSSQKKYDLIICDAPCSGSGTWGRTPEQLHFFKKDKIVYYAALQKTIATNASKAVKNGGYFLYITCSVFKKENEDVVDHLLQNTSLQMIDQRYHKGYTEKADTLFTALFLLKLD